MVSFLFLCSSAVIALRQVLQGKVTSVIGRLGRPKHDGGEDVSTRRKMGEYVEVAKCYHLNQMGSTHQHVKSVRKNNVILSAFSLIAERRDGDAESVHQHRLYLDRSY